MKIIVLGASGFLGGAASRSLSMAGHEVLGVSRRASDAFSSIQHVDANYDSEAQLASYYKEADIILHCAWDTNPSASAAQAALEVGANLQPLARFLDMAQRHFSGQLIFVSSGGALYGDLMPVSEDGQNRAGFTEQNLPSPVSYYGASKGAAELMLKAFNAQSAVPVTILRPSNVYGPGQRVKRQFGVIPALLTALHTDTQFVVRGDGSAARDYLFIDDLTSFLVNFLNHNKRAEQFATFNVCHGSSISLNELIAVAEKVAGREVSIDHRSQKPTDITQVSLSGEKAATELAWTASTSLESGLAKTWAWMLENP